MEKYTKAQMEVIEFEAEDVITTSGCNGMDMVINNLKKIGALDA